MPVISNNSIFLDVYIDDGSYTYRVSKRLSTGEWSITSFRPTPTARLMRSLEPLTEEKHAELIQRAMNHTAVERLTG